MTAMISSTRGGSRPSRVCLQAAAVSARLSIPEQAADAELINRHADEVAECYRALRHHGIEAQRKLLPLLSSGDPWVVAWAGAHALDFAPDKGERALAVLARDDSLAGRIALTTLSSWRGGTLHFP
jgi:hypothetical protein